MARLVPLVNTIFLFKVTGVMRGNIGAVLDRGNNLSDLQDRCSTRWKI